MRKNVPEDRSMDELDFAMNCLSIAMAGLGLIGSIALPSVIIVGYREGLLPGPIAVVLGLGILCIVGSLDALAFCTIKNNIFKKAKPAKSTPAEA